MAEHENVDVSGGSGFVHTHTPTHSGLPGERPGVAGANADAGAAAGVNGEAAPGRDEEEGVNGFTGTGNPASGTHVQYGDRKHGESEKEAYFRNKEATRKERERVEYITKMLGLLMADIYKDRPSNEYCLTRLMNESMMKHGVADQDRFEVMWGGEQEYTQSGNRVDTVEDAVNYLLSCKKAPVNEVCAWQCLEAGGFVDCAKQGETDDFFYDVVKQLQDVLCLKIPPGRPDRMSAGDAAYILHNLDRKDRGLLGLMKKDSAAWRLKRKALLMWRNQNKVGADALMSTFDEQEQGRPIKKGIGHYYRGHAYDPVAWRVHVAEASVLYSAKPGKEAPMEMSGSQLAQQRRADGAQRRAGMVER